MQQKKNILFVVVLVISIALSITVTYAFMYQLKEDELSSLEIQHQNDINSLGQMVSTYQQELGNLQDQIDNLEDNVSYYKNYIDIIMKRWGRTNTSLQENVSELQKLRTGSKYYLHDPTYAEVVEFIASDDTEQNTYDVESFDCEDFSILFNDNAESQGLRTAFIIIYFEEKATGHMIVGFDTVDQGMVYIEPQTDEWVNLEVGKEYWTECVVPEEGYYYEDHADDTVSEILIFW